MTTKWSVRRDRFVFGLLILLMTVANLAVAKVGIDQNNRQDEILAEREATTAANRVTTCQTAAANAVKDNAQDAADIESNTINFDLLSDLLAASDNPETVEFLAGYVERIEANNAVIEANRTPVRDCSPEGIEIYYSSGGADGYLP